MRLAAAAAAAGTGASLGLFAQGHTGQPLPPWATRLRVDGRRLDSLPTASGGGGHHRLLSSLVSPLLLPPMLLSGRAAVGSLACRKVDRHASKHNDAVGVPHAVLLEP
jgi:hypothetical protein